MWANFILKGVKAMNFIILCANLWARGSEPVDGYSIKVVLQNEVRQDLNKIFPLVGIVYKTRIFFMRHVVPKPIADVHKSFNVEFCS
jgi:hypothetical protein